MLGNRLWTRDSHHSSGYTAGISSLRVRDFIKELRLDPTAVQGQTIRRITQPEAPHHWREIAGWILVVQNQLDSLMKLELLHSELSSLLQNHLQAIHREQAGCVA